MYINLTPHIYKIVQRIEYTKIYLFSLKDLKVIKYFRANIHIIPMLRK